MSTFNEHVSKERREYEACHLEKSMLTENPFDFFEKWYKETIDAGIPDYNALTLSTVGKNGQPNARVVLLKGLETDGFVFFTNYDSRKSKNIKENPFTAMNFYWSSLERQVRIEGKIEKISAEASDAYFSIRPRGSQLATWASLQSRVLKDRAELENNFKVAEEKFVDKEVVRPSNWGGFILKPQTIEFWQGRANRMHDRFLYTLEANENWKIDRLSP